MEQEDIITIQQINASKFLTEQIDCFLNKQKEKFIFDEELLLKKVQSLLSKHISFSHYSFLFCTVNLNVPKMLHWFDWGSSKLNLYDIANYRKEQVNLVLQNPIASYSRSVMSKEGNIYLLGGQDNQGYKKTLHVYNLKSQKNPLNF